MPASPDPLLKPFNWRTLTLMAMIYAIPASLIANSDDNINYSVAVLGAISYLVVEGAFLLREAHKSYALPRDAEGYRANYHFAAYTMKALSGMVLYGAIFGTVEVARTAVSVGEALVHHLKLAFSDSQ